MCALPDDYDGLVGVARVAAQPETSLPDAWLHEGEWARVGGFYIYPRGAEYFIGRPSGANDFYDIDIPAFANMQAAIDHARWMTDEART